MRQKQGTYDKFCKNYGKRDLDSADTDLQFSDEEVVEVSDEVRLVLIIYIVDKNYHVDFCDRINI